MALIVDYVLLAAILTLLEGLLFPMIKGNIKLFFSFSASYFLIFSTIGVQAYLKTSPGKILFNLKVANLDGRVPVFMQILGRFGILIFAEGINYSREVYYFFSKNMSEVSFISNIDDLSLYNKIIAFTIFWPIFQLIICTIIRTPQTFDEYISGTSTVFRKEKMQENPASATINSKWVLITLPTLIIIIFLISLMGYQPPEKYLRLDNFKKQL